MTVYKDVELINNFLEKVPADFFWGGYIHIDKKSNINPIEYIETMQKS